MNFAIVLGKLGLWKRLCHCFYLKNVVERTFTPWNSFKMQPSIIIRCGWEKSYVRKIILSGYNYFLFKSVFASSRPGQKQFTD